MTEFNGKIYFRAGSGSPNDIELWESDGTEAGTILLKNIHPSGSSEPFGFIEYNGYLYFAAKDDLSGGLWRTDGTVAGTEKVSAVNVYTHTMPKIFNEYDGKLYFMADYPGHAYKLWVTNGTTAGTFQLSTAGAPEQFTVYNGKLYFKATDGSNDTELWESDGTEANTHIVKNINPTGSSGPWSFCLFNNLLFFSAYDGVNGTELWRSDGTEAGTFMYGEIESGFADSWPDVLTVYNNTLYFVAYSSLYGEEIWTIDGINAPTLFADINTTGPSNPGNLIVSHNKLYFVANDDSNGYELWYTDGNPSNIVKIMPSIAPEFSPCFASEFYEMNGVLYFPAAYTSDGLQLYKVIDSSASIQQHMSDDLFHLYPNPVTDVLNFSSHSIENLCIVNSYGQIVMFIENGAKTVNISGLPAGMYFVTSSTYPALRKSFAKL
jgi:ELWxxDGT repeat protein